MSGADCVVCKIIRTYLLFAVPLLALVGAGAIDGDNANRWWFVHVELIDLLAWGAVMALIGITAYRAYREFYLPVRRQRALQAFKDSLSSSGESEVSINPNATDGTLKTDD